MIGFHENVLRFTTFLNKAILWPQTKVRQLKEERILCEARVDHRNISYERSRRKWTSECHPRLTIRLGIQSHPRRRCNEQACCEQQNF